MEGQGLSLLGSHPRARLVHLRGHVGFTKDVDGALVSSRLSYRVQHVADEGGHAGLSEERSARLSVSRVVEFDILPDQLRDSLAKRETLGSIQVRRFVIDERDHGRLLRHVQGVLLQTQTFERVDVLGWTFGGELEVFMSSRETNSAYMLMYTYCFGISDYSEGTLSNAPFNLLERQHLRPPRFREPRCSPARRTC